MKNLQKIERILNIDGWKFCGKKLISWIYYSAWRVIDENITQKVKGGHILLTLKEQLDG